MVKRTVTNYKMERELYGPADALTAYGEGGCERRARKARGGLMHSAFSDFMQNRSVQMRGTFACNARADACAEKLLSFCPI